MGDRITTFNDCPKCGSKGTFECYEALSSLMKHDSCEQCGYYVAYVVDDSDGHFINISQAGEGYAKNR